MPVELRGPGRDLANYPALRARLPSATKCGENLASPTLGARDGTKETVAGLGADLEEDAMPSKQTKAPKKQEPKPKAEQERQLAKELEMSFPASDPPASTQPGSGITGPEVVKSK
jgi:hypothetical protein